MSEFKQSKCKHCGKIIVQQFSDRFSIYMWLHVGEGRGETYFNCHTTQAEPE